MTWHMNDNPWTAEPGARDSDRAYPGRQAKDAERASVTGLLAALHAATVTRPTRETRLQRDRQWAGKER